MFRIETFPNLLISKITTLQQAIYLESGNKEFQSEDQKTIVMKYRIKITQCELFLELFSPKEVNIMKMFDHFPE